MKFCVCVTLLVLIIADTSFAKETCQTCLGEACLNENVSQLDCTKFVPALPFENLLIAHDNKEDLQYGCLDLEYYQGETLNYIQQCILTSDLESFCGTLEYSVKIEKCRVEPSGSVRNVRSINEEKLKEEEIDATDSTTAETDTSAPTTENVETTTSQASAMNIISFSSLCAALILYIL